jgi:hypothetical protein
MQPLKGTAVLKKFTFCLADGVQASLLREDVLIIFVRYGSTADIANTLSGCAFQRNNSNGVAFTVS